MEEFALAEDRAKYIETLIPGTEEYYFAKALHLQNQGQQSEVEKLLPLWRERHGETSRYTEIRNRQALLTYEKDPDPLRQILQDTWGLAFDHEREVEGRATSYPTVLDPKLYAHEELKRQAYNHCNSQDLGAFTDRALRWLPNEKLDGGRLRNLLSRLRRPDHPRLVEQIEADLKAPRSGGFGSHPIHGLLLEEQLDSLAQRLPDLLKQERFVFARLAKLVPGPDVDWETDAAAKTAYLERLWTFVAPLVPAFNALKAHVLYHRLDHDRTQGVYDRERFLEYIKLPRQVPYMNPEFLQRREVKEWAFSLGKDFHAVTQLPAVSDDTARVREYLEHFFLKAQDVRPFDTWIRDGWLREVFATTKILNGVGDPEEWYSMLGDPALYQQLKDRVEISFAPTNRIHVGASEPVTLDVYIKNIEKLAVKVFRINMLNYALTKGREVDTSIDLDGLVAAEERTHEYSDPPLRRILRSFEFPSLARPGVYVVEFIGGGISSRALIRKGMLRFVEHANARGHVFRVFDEEHRPVPEATLWLGGREFRPDKDGEITVPFSTRPGSETIILRHGDFTSVGTFYHQAENIRLAAGIYIDREALVAKNEADVLVRPSLRVNACPVSLSLLKGVTLVIRSRDRDGVESVIDVPNFALHEDEESTHRFRVPEGVTQIAVTLKGKVESLSEGREIDLSDGHTFEVNGIDATEQTADFHLARTEKGYVLHFLGKTGEPRPDHPVTVVLRHPDFTVEYRWTLQTDRSGRIELGSLEGIASLQAETTAGVTRNWLFTGDRWTIPAVMHALEGEPIRLPDPGGDVSCLARVRGSYLRDVRHTVVRKGGFLELNTLPAGDYDLALYQTGVQVTIRVAPTRPGKRFLERTTRRPLQIEGRTGKEGLTVSVAHATSRTRVHVFATRFVPEFSAFDALVGSGHPLPRELALGLNRSDYVSGRDIGDEYRYILERWYAKRFPGSMLARPGLLLNPWALQETSTEMQEASAGEAYATSTRAPAAAPPPPGAQKGEGGQAPQGTSNLDFLPRPAALLMNARPNAQGKLVIPLAQLVGAAHVRVIAVDEQDILSRDFVFGEEGSKLRDLRLRDALDSTSHVIEKREATALRDGEAMEVADITTTDLEVYDSVAKVYGLYVALSKDATLEKFGFITRWPKLTEEEKRATYSEFACHELNFFLARKDTEFFGRVVKPYLRNKKAKTFLDHYLLGDDLNEYRTPWAFGRLNVVERILLSRATGDDGGARHVQDRFDLLPPDPDRDIRLFRAALKSGALETGDMLGIDRARAVAMEASASGPVATRMSADMAIEEELGDVSPAEKAKKKSDGPADTEAGGGSRAFYRTPDRTKEWAENNYYHLPIEEQGADLITVNAFWRDHAVHDGRLPFLSPHVAHASRNFAEMMLALAVLDLPFDAEKVTTSQKGSAVRLAAKSRSIVFHQQIRPVEMPERSTSILVSQNYLRDDDRWIHEGNEATEKYVEEFLIHVVYVCRVVITNPTAATQKLEVLLQIPRGAMPLRNGFVTRGLPLTLGPYATESVEYAFYFPAPGEFTHFPAHISGKDGLLSAAEPRMLRVVREPSRVDKTSWSWISQNGKVEDVLRYLEENNIERLDLARIAWRMKEASFYERAVVLLLRRHVYHDVLWSYGVYHNDSRTLREYLKHKEEFLDQCGLYLTCPLLTLDPVARQRYQHLEYLPLVNARAHRLGAKRKILNDRLEQQYANFARLLSYRENLSDDDLLEAAYYLFLQDRVEEGLKMFDRVDPRKIETRLQYDYLRVVVELVRGRMEVAREVAQAHKDYPVDRWRNLFKMVLAHIEEAGGAAAAVVDERDRDQAQGRLAATEADFDVSVEKRVVTVRYQNVAVCTVNYYRMDIELLFSKQPFMQQQSEQFSFITPNRSESIRLPEGRRVHSFDLPTEFHGAFVIVEVVAEGRRRSQLYCANHLHVQVVEPYGQVRVLHAESGQPLSGVYVKTFARMQGGAVAFYKDGYTDLRGRFDYASLSTDELDRVERFALLVLHDQHGAVVREAAPPKR